MSRSTTETCCGASRSNVQFVISSEQQIMALLDLHRDIWHNPELSELVRNHTLKTQEFSAALHAYLDAHQSLILCKCEESSARAHGLFHEILKRFYQQQLLMWAALQRLDNRFAEKLHSIRYWKKVSAVSFTAAAATSAAVAAANASPRRPAVAAAAAAASVLFGALGSWMHSLLNKRESGVKKDKEMVGVMIIGGKIAIKDLSEIYVLSEGLQFEAGDRKEVAAMKRRFEDLQEKANEYSRDMKWVGKLVLHTIIKNLDGNEGF